MSKKLNAVVLLVVLLKRLYKLPQRQDTTQVGFQTSNKTIVTRLSHGQLETNNYLPHVKEAKAVVLLVVLLEALCTRFQRQALPLKRVSGLSNKTTVTRLQPGSWEIKANYLPHVKEAKRRGLLVVLLEARSGCSASSILTRVSFRTFNKIFVAHAGGSWEIKAITCHT